MQFLTDLVTFQNVVMMLFFTVAIWFNYNAGFQSGVEYGADTALAVLESERIIALEKNEDGDYIIRAGDENRSIKSL
jgi:hypothetical protein